MVKTTYNHFVGTRIFLFILVNHEQDLELVVGLRNKEEKCTYSFFRKLKKYSELGSKAAENVNCKIETKIP